MTLSLNSAKMHLYLYARGIIQQVRLWEAMAQGQFWQWERYNPETEKTEKTLVQGALRPSVLGAYEYIFPEDCLAEVLAVFGLNQNKEKGLRLATLRRVFGASKISRKTWREAKEIKPSIILEGSKRALSGVNVPGVSLHVIGVKKDTHAHLKASGLVQEWL